MANLQTEGVRVQVLISEDTELGKFNDALYFSPTEFAAISDANLEKTKKDRADKWVKSVKDASKVEYTPTVEDLSSEKAELVARIAELDAKIDVKVAEVDAKVIIK